MYIMHVPQTHHTHLRVSVSLELTKIKIFHQLACSSISFSITLLYTQSVLYIILKTLGIQISH